ncbi:hypothetical protein F4776DRAFT_666288 [Hypoxylon sp. NC0597]|nr:hypothetical protein F4776DRAFT_666288 [Hypoxylon sp. NC0597]
MQRLKNLLRRRNHEKNISSSTNNGTTKAPLSRTQRSFEVSKAQTAIEDFQYKPSQHHTGGYELIADRSTFSRGHSESTSSFANGDSHHGAGERTHSKPPHKSLYDRDEVSRHIMRNSRGISEDFHSNGQTPTAEQLGHSSTGNIEETRNNSKSLSEEKQNQPNVVEDRAKPGSIEKPNKDNMNDANSQMAKEAVPDLRNTVDTDETVSYAPVVTHQTVRPQVHEITEEQIHRDIHNHDVYHRIQLVYDIEVLPTRHFISGPVDRIVEISEDELTECTSSNQRQHVDKELWLSSKGQKEPL